LVVGCPEVASRVVETGAIPVVGGKVEERVVGLEAVLSAVVAPAVERGEGVQVVARAVEARGEGVQVVEEMGAVGAAVAMAPGATKVVREERSWSPRRSRHSQL